MARILSLSSSPKSLKYLLLVKVMLPCSYRFEIRRNSSSAFWRSNWANLSTYFKYPQKVRRLIYATNVIDGFNRQLRKVTKATRVFPTDDSLLKMPYLAMMDITKKEPDGGRAGA